MTNRKILLISHVLLFLVFGYLTYHHYSLALGQDGGTFCQINSYITCDKVAMSSYSEIFNIPVAVLGMVYAAFMFCFLGMTQLGWLEESKSHKAAVQLITTFSAITSLVMGFISFFILKSVCPFCTFSYLISFVQLFLVFQIYKPVQLKQISGLFSNEGKSYLLSFLAIPFLSWFIAGTVNDQYGFSQIKKIAPEKIYQWQQKASVNLSAETGLLKGDLQSQKVLVEFADFKCPHCKVASSTIRNFSKSNPEFKVVFKPFPLDGNCNPHVSFKGDNSRCIMAGLVLCAQQMNQAGWVLHDYFFEEQERLSSVADFKEEYKVISQKLNLNYDAVYACAESAETFALLKQLADEGKNADVQGTPTIFLNAKKLEYAQFPEVLKQAAATLK